MQVTLITIGRKSGQPRAVPLYAFEDGDRLVVVGSFAGAAKDPAWALNLRAEPRATIHRGEKSWDVMAQEIDGAAYDRLWGLVTTKFPLYEKYQSRTKRVIPLFALEPAAKD